jgi:plastocyanin
LLLSTAIPSDCLAINIYVLIFSIRIPITYLFPPPHLPSLITETITIDPWKLGQTYPEQKASVNDSIKFVWKGTHGVFKIPSGTCPSDFTPSSSNGISEVSAPKADGTAEFKFPSAGTYWFACPVGDGAHCEGGMLIKVVVS